MYFMLCLNKYIILISITWNNYNVCFPCCTRSVQTCAGESVMITPDGLIYKSNVVNLRSSYIRHNMEKRK